MASSRCAIRRQSAAAHRPRRRRGSRGGATLDAGRKQHFALVGGHGGKGIGDVDESEMVLLRGGRGHRLLPAFVQAHLLALGLADVADVGVAQDRVEPGAEVGAFLELVLVGPGPQHGLLHQVIDHVAATGAAPCEPLQSSLDTATRALTPQGQRQVSGRRRLGRRAELRCPRPVRQKVSRAANRIPRSPESLRHRDPASPGRHRAGQGRACPLRRGS